MSQTSNSARKLYDILCQARDYAEDSSVVSVWKDVLGANPDDPQDVSDKFGQLVELFNDTKSDIQQLEDIKADRYIKAINLVQYVLISRNSVSGEWKSIKNAINERDLELIGSCADLMTSQQKITRTILPEKLEELHQEVQNLIKSVTGSELNSDLKRLLIRHLREIESVILNYQIRGSSGLEKVTNQTIGSLFIRLFRSDELKEKDKEIIGSTINWVIKTNALISVYQRAKNLLEHVQQFFSLPPGN